HMWVRVERDANSRTPEPLGDDLWMDAGSQRFGDHPDPCETPSVIDSIAYPTAPPCPGHPHRAIRSQSSRTCSAIGTASTRETSSCHGRTISKFLPHRSPLGGRRGRTAERFLRRPEGDLSCAGTAARIGAGCEG